MAASTDVGPPADIRPLVDSFLPPDAKTHKKFTYTNTLAIHLLPEELNRILGDTEVVFLEADSSMMVASVEGTSQVPPDVQRMQQRPGQHLPWGVQAIGADIAKDHGVIGQSIKVAVLDTGIAPHPDLHVYDGLSFVDESPTFIDDHGHGAHVAGIIGALDNAFGIVGVAPGVELYGVKVLDHTGTGSYSQVIQGIEWAMDHQIDIVHMSFVGTEYSVALRETIRVATKQGMMFVAAARNKEMTNPDGMPSFSSLAPLSSYLPSYPADYSEVISVGALTKNGAVAFISNDTEADFYAPGLSILSTTVDGQYDVT